MVSARPVGSPARYCSTFTVAVEGAAVPLLMPVGSVDTPETEPMPRISTVQVPGTPGPLVETFAPSTGSAIELP